MLAQRLANIAFALTIIVASLWFAIVAQGFETTGLLATSGLPSRFFPQLMLGITALCALIVLVTYWRHGSASEDDNEYVFNEAGDMRRGLLMLAVAVSCYLIWSKFGFIPMAVVLGPSSLLAMGVRSPLIYLTVLTLTGLIYLVFTQLLGIYLT